MVRFLGNSLPDPSLAGSTSLLHEAKVDVVTVPDLSEHLSSAETTEQLSGRSLPRRR